MKKTALVTGAAVRLGRAIVEALAHDGYNVAIHYNSSANEAGQLSGDLNKRYGSGSAKIFKADLHDIDACKKLPHDVFKAFGGRLDLLVNNASIFEKIPLESITDGVIEKYHKMHVIAPATLCIESAKYLKSAKPGRIVNIVDVYADYPKAGYLPYTISKAALKALTRQLAIELAPDTLVNAIAPGAILQPVSGGESVKIIESKIPLKKFGEPSDIAHALLFLAKTAYVTGQTIVVDGGRSLTI